MAKIESTVRAGKKQARRVSPNKTGQVSSSDLGAVNAAGALDYLEAGYADKRRIPFWKRLGIERNLHLMVLPAIVIVFLMDYLPMYGILIAFKRFDVFKGVLASPWAKNSGFEHFVDFFKAPTVWNVIRNTLVIAFLKLGFLSFPPVILALVLNEVRVGAFKKVSQTISYLPHFISWVVIGGIIYQFLNPSHGIVNRLLVQLNLVDKPVDFINTEVYFWPLVVTSHIWKEIGWSSIIYLATIATIDPNLYEAAQIDGAGRWRRIRHITWPHLLGIFMILFILHCGRIMSGYGATFNQVYVLGNAYNRGVSDILDTYILRVGLDNMRFSFATAIGLLKSVLNLLLLVVANALSRKLTERSLF